MPARYHVPLKTPGEDFLLPFSSPGGVCLGFLAGIVNNGEIVSAFEIAGPASGTKCRVGARWEERRH